MQLCAGSTGAGSTVQAGLGAGRLARLRSPLGLLPRARDPQELAVSILAEAMQAYRERCHPEESRAAETRSTEARATSATHADA